MSKYSQLPLKTKILLPLFFTFLGIWSVGTVSFGYFFTQRLETKLKAETENVSSLVMHAFHHEKQLLFLKARWVANYKEISQSVAKDNKAKLLRSLLPLKEFLQLDFIKVIDKNGVVLGEVHQEKLANVQFDDLAVNEAASIGMDLFDIIAAKNNKSSLLVGLTSVKSTQEILGGVIVGKEINEEVLTQIRASAKTHLVAFQNNQATASTLRTAKTREWQSPEIAAPPTKVTIAGERFIAKSVKIMGLNGTTAKIVLLNPVAPLEETQKQLWLAIMVFSLSGVIVFSLVVTKVIDLVTRRIIDLTAATRKLAIGDMSTRINLTGNDEISTLAQSFNNMAEQIYFLWLDQEKAYEQLNQYNQTLEQKVEERTQELNNNNIYLQKTLQELQRTQTQMIQSEKMSSLGQMVAGIAHEINNPVTFIHGNLEHARRYTHDLLNLIELYQKYYPEPPEEIDDEIETIDLDYLKEDCKKIFNSMQNGSERISQIVLSLRNFSRLDESECKQVDIHEGIDSTLLILHSRLQIQSKYPAIKIVKAYGSLPLVECYPGQLNQVFMNIIINAIDALHEYNQQRTIEQIKLKPNCIHITTELIDGNWSKIKIADNGSGISEDILPKLFDPFFTTKEVGKGTGLGLSVSYQIIVDNHGGKLSCESTIGKGTEFIIEIPITQRKFCPIQVINENNSTNDTVLPSGLGENRHIEINFNAASPPLTRQGSGGI
ncbi:MAG: ATP-binding protein [Calothrix sp. MO_167.B12]|nr:ATP-binding protein [Calothrix sp. MO_167.B12]